MQHDSCRCGRSVGGAYIVCSATNGGFQIEVKYFFK